MLFGYAIPAIGCALDFHTLDFTHTWHIHKCEQAAPFGGPVHKIGEKL